MYDLRIENIVVTTAVKEFIIRHANGLRTIELCVDSNHIQTILDHAINVVSVILDIRKPLSPISHKKLAVLVFRGIQQVDFLNTDTTQMIVDTLSNMLQKDNLPRLVAVRFLDFNRDLIGLNIRSIPLWRSLVHVTSSCSLSVYDMAGYLIDGAIVE